MKKHCFPLLILFLSLAIVSAVLPDYAEVPTDSSSTQLSIEELSKMFSKCEKVLVGKFRGYESRNGEIICLYSAQEILKGSLMGGTVRIKHNFSDEMNSKKMEEIKGSMIPKIGSKWIIFIQIAIPYEGRLTTYKGSRGIFERTNQNYSRVLKARDWLAIQRLSANSKNILVGEYCRYEIAKVDSRRRQLIGIYMPLKILKGVPFSKHISIRYETVYDKFQTYLYANKLPEKGSKWILFIKDYVPTNGAHFTVDGEVGRFKFSTEKMRFVLDALKEVGHQQ